MGVDNDHYSSLAELEIFLECPECYPDDLPAFNSVSALDVFNFDFQQNLPTPKLTVGQQFYLCLLWTYLFGVYSASTRVLLPLYFVHLWEEQEQNGVSGGQTTAQVRIKTLVYFFKTLYADRYTPGLTTNY